MKREKKYYRLCVNVMMYDENIESYRLWFIQDFSSRKNYKIWRDGFFHGLDHSNFPYRAKLGEPYVKYSSFKPRY